MSFVVQMNDEVFMLDKLNKIEKSALENLTSIRDESALEAWRVANLGRSSPLMSVFSELGELSKEERPAVGQAANRVKLALESALAERAQAVQAAALAKSLEEEQLDVTLPGRTIHQGRLHPSTQQLRHVLDILAAFQHDRFETFFGQLFGSPSARYPRADDNRIEGGCVSGHESAPAACHRGRFFITARAGAPSCPATFIGNTMTS